MLSVRPFRQKSGFCGAASLKIVLDYYGVEKSEAELVRLSGSTVEKGVSAKGIIAAAKKLGFKAFHRDFSTISQLKQLLGKGIPVIVDWFSTDDGHYSVAAGIDKRNVYLQDPELGKVRKMPIEFFNRVWFDFPGRFIRSNDDVIVRRMIVVKK